MKLPLPLLVLCAGSIGVGAIAAFQKPPTQSAPAPTQPINQPTNQPQLTPLDPSKVSGSPPVAGNFYAPASASQPTNQPQLPSVTIQSCNGNPADANVRSAPGGAIVGYVPAGSQVFLTGRVSGSWHQVIAPGAIADPGNQIPGTVWLAGCFTR